MRILVIALSGIGDALLFTPAASLIRRSLPDVQLDALVMFKSAEEIYRQTGLFNKILFHDFLNASLLNSLKFVLGLRRKYDASLNVYPANRREYNVIQYMIGANKRAGVKYLRQDLLQLGFLNNSRVNENDLLHNVEENIRLSEKLLGFSSVDTPDLTLPLGEDDRAFAKIYFDKARIDDGAIVIGFHAGSATFKNQINRRWDPQKFAELARLLVKNRNAHVLVFGGPEEKTLITEIAHTSGSKQVLVPPSSTIIESASLMKRCNAFVTNDSGMMHLAAALKLPTVAIIGPTNTNYIHPWHTEYEVASLFLDCSPCFVYSPRPLHCSRNDIKFKCIKELTAETVFQRVIHLLDRS